MAGIYVSCQLVILIGVLKLLSLQAVCLRKKDKFIDFGQHRPFWGPHLISWFTVLLYIMWIMVIFIFHLLFSFSFFLFFFQDSLEKFSSKKLKDCGEDLLVEISEVLFNELAFFRLMQDLDNNSSSVQSRGQHKANTDVLQSFTKKVDEICFYY